MKKRSSFGWSELLSGILCLLIGVFAFINPSLALGGLIILFSIVILSIGISDILLYIRINKRAGIGPVISLITGCLVILLSVLLLTNIHTSKYIVGIILPFWFIVHCINRLTNIGFVKFFGGKFLFIFTLISNIAGILIGLYLLFNPRITISSIGRIIGIYLMTIGVNNLLDAFSKTGE